MDAKKAVAGEPCRKVNAKSREENKMKNIGNIFKQITLIIMKRAKIEPLGRGERLILKIGSFSNYVREDVCR